jgi:hypothetical protein
MDWLKEFAKTLPRMRIEGLVAVVILGAFALAAYAIHAVLTMALK